MAARTRTVVFIALSSALLMWVWGLAIMLFGLRWYSVARPGPPNSVLFPYGEMRVGVDASYPPFAVIGEQTEYGIDIDIAEAIGRRLNIPVRFVNMGFDGLYDSLRVDQVDVLLSALTIDYSRTNEVIYTVPYFNAGLVLVTEVGSTLHAMTTLSGHSLAFEFGGDADQVSRTWLRRISAFSTLTYETSEHALDAVRLKIADAALVDATTAGLYLRKHPEWAAQTSTVTDTLFAVAVRFNRYETYVAITNALQSLLDDGTIKQIIRNWIS